MAVLQGIRPAGAEEMATEQSVELSVVMPCLDEADTLLSCIRKAQEGLANSGVRGEIIVADNGSTDGSIEIARSCGARVVHVPVKGYGSALMGGIKAARGRWVVMADADDSYDFREIPLFVGQLQQGYDMVQGCRLPAGGGTIQQGAMPPLHRWLGNPVFSLLCRRWFGAPVHDVYCGMRGFRKQWQEELGQRCIGMEFATEMVLKAAMFGARIAEVPITLHPDGRIRHRPHLRTFRDGWRTLRFFLMCSPGWLFIRPGLLLLLVGLLGYGLALPQIVFHGVHFDAHTLLFASLAILCGYQSILFGVFTKVFAVEEGLVPRQPAVDRLLRSWSLEMGLMGGTGAMVLGGLLLAWAVITWWSVGFGNLDYSQTMRRVIPGMTLVSLGLLTCLASFFLSILGLRRGQER